MFGLDLRTTLDAFCALGCVFALWKGGAAERAGAIVIILNILVAQVGDFLLPASTVLIHFIDDGLAAVLMLVITVRFGALWMGGVMLFYAVQFALHSFYLVTERPNDYLHALVNNVDFNGIVWCLIIGAAVSWRRRIRTARAAAAA